MFELPLGGHFPQNQSADKSVWSRLEFDPEFGFQGLLMFINLFFLSGNTRIPNTVFAAGLFS